LAEYEKYAALAQLALGAAHEINNPLLGILSHLELSLRDAKSEEDQIEIERCIEGTKRISQTIRGLLNYTRPDPLLLTRLNLNRMVDDTLSFLEHQPLFRGITMEKDIPTDLPEITADANQLSQIVMNLLLNAAQASPDVGTITIAAQKVKFADSVEITVSDTGKGTGLGLPRRNRQHVRQRASQPSARTGRRQLHAPGRDQAHQGGRAHHRRY
jgi:signal transduction histidine kinase